MAALYLPLHSMIKWCATSYYPVLRLSLMFLLVCCMLADLQAQSGAYLSRDNHAGLSHQRSSWDGAMPPGNTSALIDTKITVRGYLMHGLAGTPSNVSFSGAGSLLVVEDTLRIHGDLSILNGASIHIKPGGVLIVHGNYLQQTDVKFTNEGKAVFLGDWKWSGTGSYANSGHIYTMGSVTGGIGHKTFNDLWTEDRPLYYFAGLKVVKEGCTGLSGGLTVSGEFLRVVRWESSTDFFRSDVNEIDFQGTTYSYSNLEKTTSFRVYLETTAGVYEYSAGATVVVLESSRGGTISGPAVLCGPTNKGALLLNSFTGSVLRWESSLDSFATAGTTVATGGESYSFSDLSQTTSFRAVVKNGSCGEASSSIFTVQVDPASAGGTINGSTTVCAGENTGELLLSGYTGTILRWESSADGFATIQPIAFTGAVYTYEDISQATSYRAVVQSGSCALAYSTVAKVEVSAVAGGELNGSQTVCAGENTGTLGLSGYTGEILHWEQSSDGFATIERIANTTASFTFNNLSQTTQFRAVVGNAVCKPVYSTVAEIIVEEAVVPGTLTASVSAVCAGSNEGSLSLSGYSGTILRWESSTDHFTTFTAVAHTSAALTFMNLSETTSYRVVLDGGACGDILSPVATVVVDAPAEGGSIEGGDIPVCAEGNGGNLQLINFTGQVLRWEKSTDSFDQHIEEVVSTEPLMSYTNLTETTSFRAVVGNGSCSEVYSAESLITVDQPAVGGQLSSEIQTVCAAENGGIIYLQDYVGSVLRWESSTDGFATAATTVATGGESYSFSSLSQTTSFRAVVKNGSCGEAYSSELIIEVDALPEGGVLIGEATVCPEVNEGTIQLTNYSGQILRWEKSTDGFGAHVESLDHKHAKFSYLNLSSTTSFRAVVGNGSCGESNSDIVVIQVTEPAEGGVIAGAKRVNPGENTGILNLESYTGTIVHWEQSSDGFVNDVRVLTHQQPDFTYENIEVDTWYRVLVQQGSCAAVYSLPTKVWINEAPIAVADTFYVEPEKAFSSEISLLQNDFDADGDVLVVTTGQRLITSAGNSLDIYADGHINFEAPASFRGIDTYEYRICDEAGEASRCAVGTIVLVVENKPVIGDKLITIYDGFSPNGDDRNDNWIIDHIEQYKNNLVQVFDRYGVLVYEVEGYDNEQKVFEGYSNKGALGRGGLLPEATYFYRIVLSKGQPVKTGYFILNR